jgi:hypothetical protein
MFVAARPECGSRIFQPDDGKVRAEFLRKHFQQGGKAVAAQTLAAGIVGKIGRARRFTLAAMG